MLPNLDNKFANSVIGFVKFIYYLITDFLKLSLGRLKNIKTQYTQDDLVSVIIPTFNRVEYLLKRSLPSVLRQTHKNIEVIVVSHGSTDQTNKKITELSKIDSRIKLVIINRNKKYYPNKSQYHWLVGPVLPINAGLKSAKGKWIARIDDDDIWMANHLEVSLSEAIFRRIEFISSAYEIVYKNGSKLIYPSGDIPIGGVQTWLYKSYLKNIYANIDSWRKKWNKVNDTDLQERFIKIGVKIGHTNQILAQIIPRLGEEVVGSKSYILNKKKYEDFYNV